MHPKQKIKAITQTILQDNRMLHRIFWPLWGFSLLCLLLMLGYLFGYRYNATPSLPRGIYKIAGGTKPVHGEVVSFCLEDAIASFALERGYLQAGSCPSGVQPLLKKVAGLPGDSIEQSTEGLAVNGQRLQHSSAKHQDSSGRPLNASSLLPDQIPDGMALVLSDQHEGSFDSRYFGLIPIRRLEKVTPVLTF